jgi:uncharacterized YigZ family protein
MLFDDTYKTILAPSEGTYSDRGSRFLGYAVPLSKEDDVKNIISGIQALHPKARHHCWAFRLTTDRSVFRLNDDGEPSGSAGRPILNTLLSYDLTNVIVIVVRYFGGTLLGVPGLIKAYKAATTEALNAARIIEKTVNDFYLLEFEYSALNEVMKIIKDHNLEVVTQNLDLTCAIKIAIRKSKVSQIIEALMHSPVSVSYCHTA